MARRAQEPIFFMIMIIVNSYLAATGMRVLTANASFLAFRNDSSSSRGVRSSDSGVAIEAKSRKTITRPFYFLYHIYGTLGYDIMYCRGGGRVGRAQI